MATKHFCDICGGETPLLDTTKVLHMSGAHPGTKEVMWMTTEYCRGCIKKLSDSALIKCDLTVEETKKLNSNKNRLENLKEDLERAKAKMEIKNPTHDPQDGDPYPGYVYPPLPPVKHD